jgi:hypothetical protein
MKKKIALFFIVVFMLLAGSCNQTDLYGEIVIAESEIVNDNNLLLLLKVPDELSEIHDVEWILSEINEEKEIVINDFIFIGEDLLNYYSEDELKDIFNVDMLNFDRIAMFIPASSGKYIIETFGFYKQTNPQIITEIEIVIE